jgi:hypothetical protein
MIPHEDSDKFMAEKMLIATDDRIPTLIRQQAVEDVKTYFAEES